MPGSDATIAFVSFGVAVNLVVRHTCTGRCPHPALVDDVRTMLPPGATPRPVDGPTGETTHHVITVACHDTGVTVRDPDGLTRTLDDLAVALHVVDQSIRSTVAVHAPGLVFIHAGAVAVDGRALVLPGTSMAGKTTLVAALVRAGAGYLSDEYAVFDADGLVHPFARRLSVREATGRREVPVAELGGRAVDGPLPVGLVAEVTYTREGTWQVVPGDQATCARALIANAVAAQARSGEVLRLAASVARTTPFVHGTRGDVDDAVSALLDLARAGTPGPGGPAQREAAPG